MALNLERDYENEPLQNKHIRRVDKTRMTDAQYRGLIRLNALCLGIICILQATLNIALRLHFNSDAETHLLHTSFYNLTIDELQTSYTNLVKKTDQLQTRYYNLVRKTHQLPTRYPELKHETVQLPSINFELEKETDQSVEKREGVQKKFPESGDIALEWKHFNSSFYYISTERKTWVQSRQECIKKEADLAIIDSQEEENFIITHLENKSAWVGLKSEDTKKEWKWVDGTALNTGGWAVEQPNSQNSELHAEKMSVRQNWISMPCAREEWWVCEKTVSK